MRDVKRGKLVGRAIKYKTVSSNMYIYLLSTVYLASRAVQRIKSASRSRWSLSLGLKDPGLWSSHQKEKT